MYVDATLGAGGHAEGVLQAHPEIEVFYGFDQDQSALDIAKDRLSPWLGKLKLIHGNFAKSFKQVNQVDGILMDIGVSSMQLDQAERGFSFMHDGPLDMRMDSTAELTAADVVNTYTEESLGKIFRDYGEEKRWRRAAAALVEYRQKKTIETTFDLKEALKHVLTPLKGKKSHPMTQVFQALRIYVNSELDVLEKAIPQAIDVLKPGGVLGIITFHSLEDRMVKRAFQHAASDKESTSGIAGVFIDKEPIVNLLTRKPIVPSVEEELENPRSRSAKLRVVEKR